MSLIKKSFKALYPEKEFNYITKLKYSAKFKSYNANIKLKDNLLQLNLSRKWKSIDNEIKMGLIQELITKLFKTKVKTKNIDMYNIFIKKIALYTPKTNTDVVLEESFNKVNEKYFYGMIEKPNFVWHNSKNKLGSYDFGSDTVSMSKVLKDSETLDYVMYHELLHKKLKFDHTRSRTYHHTKEFRIKEREFENSEEIEKNIPNVIRHALNKKFIKKTRFFSTLDLLKKFVKG